MQSFVERKEENDHFGSTKLVYVDPFGEEILTLGEDDHLLNCYITESISLSSAHDLKVIDQKNINSFCFLPQSYTFLVVAEKQVYSFNWPKCDIQKIIYEHENEINLICATSSEDIIAISDINNDIYFLKHSGQNQYKLIQKVFSSPDSKIAWIDFGPLCDTFAIYTNDLNITAIDNKTYETIFTEQTSSFCLPCFTNQSDLLFFKNGKIISKSQIHHNFAVFQNEKNDFDIVSIIPSISSNHIATYDSNGTITVSKFERSIFNYSNELNLDSPQILPSVLTINHPSSKIKSFNWRYDIIAAGDEEGALYFWEGVAGIPKPVFGEAKANISLPNSSVSNPPASNPTKASTSKKKKPMSLIESLTAPVDPSRARKTKDDESLSDFDENDDVSSTKSTSTKKKAQTSKAKQTKLKQKQLKSTKLTAKKFLQDEKVSDDEDDESEMENFIETREEFEERIKQNAPEPEPEPELDLEILPSESSSDHEIDIEPYLTPEQREKLHHQREEEEMLEKAAAGAFSSAGSTDIDEENIEDLEDNEDFEFDHIFMPGNNDNYVGNRRYMCWNHYAAILLRRDKEDESKTEIDIHTNTETRAIPNLNKYSLASVDENGLILASQTEIYYEHHKTWAPDRTTSIVFSSEKVSLVACGFEWFAAATDSPCIHLFTSAGLEIGIIPLPLSCLFMVGRGKYLFYAFPNGDDIEFSVVSVLKNSIVVGNRSICGIRPIKWVGFDNDNKVYIQDRTDIVYLLSKDFSWQWIPVLDMKDYFDTTTTSFWIVKVEDDTIYGVPLRSQRSPATYPIPRLHSLETHIMTFDTEVRPWLLKKVMPGEKKQKADAELLKIFPSAIQNDQEFRAYHIAEQMQTGKARKFVVGYADKLNATIVADKLTGTDSKPQKRVFTIKRQNSETRKRNTPSRSLSNDQVVYVRKSTNKEKEDQPKKNEKIENEINNDESDDDNDNDEHEEKAEEEVNEKQPIVNNLFDALKKLGSKPTTLIAPKNDFGPDLGPKKKPKKKSDPIVQRKRPRKAKNNDDTTSFQPLFH